MNANPEYNYAEHVHRFAAWAASRAASTSTLRFCVADGKAWLETVPDLKRCAGNPEELPDIDAFDDKHSEWREIIIRESRNRATHGIAAKLINVYLKAAVIHSGFEERDKVKAVHPPIDRLLLTSLKMTHKEIWRGQNLSWSTFNSDQYSDAIDKIRRTLGSNVALWRVEEHWAGNQ